MSNDRGFRGQRWGCRMSLRAMTHVTGLCLLQSSQIFSPASQGCSPTNYDLKQCILKLPATGRTNYY